MQQPDHKLRYTQPADSKDKSGGFDLRVGTTKAIILIYIDGHELA